jgi:septal ring factor EnvC (AmiA/AmiB activator)
MDATARKAIEKQYRARCQKKLDTHDQLVSEVRALSKEVETLEEQLARFRRCLNWSDQDLLDARDYISNR